MQFSLGVAGCGKTTFMQEFLMDVYAGKFVTITGPNPSVLLASTTNSQCQALYTLVLALHANEESNVPKPRWVVSQSFWDEAEVTGNDFVRLHAITKFLGQNRVRLLYIHTILQESGMLDFGLTLCALMKLVRLPIFKGLASWAWQRAWRKSWATPFRAHYQPDRLQLSMPFTAAQVTCNSPPARYAAQMRS